MLACQGADAGADLGDGAAPGRSGRRDAGGARLPRVGAHARPRRELPGGPAGRRAPDAGAARGDGATPRACVHSRCRGGRSPRRADHHQAVLYAPAFAGAALLRLQPPDDRAGTAAPAGGDGSARCRAGGGAPRLARRSARSGGAVDADRRRQHPADRAPRRRRAPGDGARALGATQPGAAGAGRASASPQPPVRAHARHSAGACSPRPCCRSCCYRNAYPYFFPFILAPAMIVASFGGAALARRPGG